MSNKTQLQTNNIYLEELIESLRNKALGSDDIGAGKWSLCGTSMSGWSGSFSTGLVSNPSLFYQVNGSIVVLTVVVPFLPSYTYVDGSILKTIDIYNSDNVMTRTYLIQTASKALVEIIIASDDEFNSATKCIHLQLEDA